MIISIKKWQQKDFPVFRFCRSEKAPNNFKKYISFLQNYFMYNRFKLSALWKKP